MVYDEKFADRVGGLLMTKTDFQEKKMFGGLTFMIRGHMSMGVQEKDFMVRVGPDQYEEALSLPNAREMDFTGRALKGFIYVPIEKLDNDKTLLDWITLCLNYNSGLAPK